MKKTKNVLLTLVLCSFAFGLGLSANNLAYSDVGAMKVAYINVPRLLSASKVLKAAEEQKTKQTQEMLKWYETASADINKQTTQKGKESLIKKYEAQLTQKKTAIKNEYAKKVGQVDSQLDQAIKTKAKALGYNLVLRKDSVLFGGVDITDQILPSVK